jgi:hypothetical protein
MKEIASQGSDRVAVADGWIAWTDGPSISSAILEAPDPVHRRVTIH